MTIKDLQTEMIAAMKAKEKNRKDTISGLIAAVKKVAIDEGCRDDIPESMVETVILKELKTAKEQVETCPEDRTELLAEYNEKVNICLLYTSPCFSFLNFNILIYNFIRNRLSYKLNYIDVSHKPADSYPCHILNPVSWDINLIIYISGVVSNQTLGNKSRLV